MRQSRELGMPTRFENLETLRKAAWDSFATRREFAWKVSIAFWSLLAAFIAGVVTNKVYLGCLAKGLLTAFPIILGCAHLLWIWGIRRGDLIDRMEEGDYRDAMRCEAAYSETEKLKKFRNQVVESTGFVKHWNAVAQAMATIALLSLAVISIWLIR